MKDQKCAQDQLGDIEVMVEEKKRTTSDNLTGDDAVDGNGVIVKELSPAKVGGTEAGEFDGGWKK